MWWFRNAGFARIVARGFHDPSKKTYDYADSGKTCEDTNEGYRQPSTKDECADATTAFPYLLGGSGSNGGKPWCTHVQNGKGVRSQEWPNCFTTTSISQHWNDCGVLGHDSLIKYHEFTVAANVTAATALLANKLDVSLSDEELISLQNVAATAATSATGIYSSQPTNKLDLTNANSTWTNWAEPLGYKQICVKDAQTNPPPFKIMAFVCGIRRDGNGSISLKYITNKEPNATASWINI